jgi:quinoprotein relay system zinc metallohydrolase 2
MALKPILFFCSLLALTVILLFQFNPQIGLYWLDAHANNSHKLSQVAASSYVRAGHHGTIFESEDIANIGFIVGTECVAVIDTGGSFTEGLRLLQAIRTRTDTPICYVINTHVHPDHMLGNNAFQQEGVRFVGHQNLPQALALVGDIFLQRLRASKHLMRDDTEIIFPDVLVSDTLQLDLGDRKLLLTAHGVAHTAADLSIYDPKDDLLWMGDLLFLGHVPALDGSLIGWIDEIEGLKKKQFGVVVPGHGPASVTWPQASRDLLRYLKGLRDETKVWLESGGDIQGAQEQVGLSERTHWQLFDQFHRRNVISAYAELEWE